MEKKHLDKIQHQHMITSLSKFRKEKFFNIILKIYKKLTTNITVNSEKLECSKAGNKERMSPLITPFEYNTESPS